MGPHKTVASVSGHLAAAQALITVQVATHLGDLQPLPQQDSLRVCSSARGNTTSGWALPGCPRTVPVHSGWSDVDGRPDPGTTTWLAAALS